MKLKILSGGRAMSFLKYKILMNCRPTSRLGKVEYRYWLLVYSVAQRWRKIDRNLIIATIAMLVLVLQVFIIVTAVKGQELENRVMKSGGLQIGDQVPDVSLGTIINYKHASAKISDFKGKVLILDFWATWCGACLGTFPKTDSLQRQFGDKIQFMPVAYQDEKEVRRFLNLVNQRVPINLPSVVNDKQLSTLFPHLSFPHYVWVNGQGKVVAITDPEAVNAGNIQRLLAGGALNAPEKRDVSIPFNSDKPLFFGGNGGDGSTVRYHAMLSDYVEGLQGRITVFNPDATKGRRLSAINYSLRKLYRVAYAGDDWSFSNNRIILEVKDPDRFTSSKTGVAYQEWARNKNAFCYEVQVPPSAMHLMYPIMQEDLRRNFPQYDAKIETRKVKALVLVRTSKEDKLKTGGGKAAINISPFACTLQNRPLAALTQQLAQKFLAKSLPLVDETGYAGNVDLKIDANMSNPASLAASLRKYGLDLVEAERSLPMLVVRDKEAEPQMNGGTLKKKKS